MSDFLEGALANFQAVEADKALTGPTRRLLLLAESRRVDRHAELRQAALKPERERDPDAGEWTFERTAEPVSLRATRADGEELVLVAGRQIVTQESLEILALGTCRQFPDALPATDVLARVASEGAIPVLPWGFGKWTGRRGRILAALLADPHAAAACLGDNSGRLAGLPPPRQFRRAAKLGMRILPGTDPLPFPSESRRAGSFGFILPVAISRERPTKQLGQALAAHVPMPYGRGERLLPFLLNQSRMAIEKHLRPALSRRHGPT